MVMLTEDEVPFRSLRIIIGQPEANAILVGWQGTVSGRPSTWDLFTSMVTLLGARLDRVVITAVHEERHYFAQIELEHDGARRILACRPSDAIALAVRGDNVEIMAEASVLDAAGVLPDGSRWVPPPEPDLELPPAPAPELEPEADTEPEQAGAEAALAAREAALAAREAELAVREAALRVRAVASTTEAAGAGAGGTAATPGALGVNGGAATSEQD